MPVTQTIRACGRCGAVVAIASPEGGGIDNEAAHLGWHESLDGIVTVLARHAQTSLRARLAGLLSRRGKAG